MPMMARMTMVCTPDEPVHRIRMAAIHRAMRASDVLRRRPCMRPSGPRPRRRASNMGGRRSLVSPGGSQSATSGEKGQAMIVTVCMDAAGAIWLANGQGDVLAECFFKAEDETEDELRLMGYHRLLIVYPAAHLAAGTTLEPAELGEIFVEGARADRDCPAAPRQAACRGEGERAGLGLDARN